MRFIVHFVGRFGPATWHSVGFDDQGGHGNYQKYSWNVSISSEFFIIYRLIAKDWLPMQPSALFESQIKTHRPCSCTFNSIHSKICAFLAFGWFFFALLFVKCKLQIDYFKFSFVNQILCNRSVQTLNSLKRSKRPCKKNKLAALPGLHTPKNYTLITIIQLLFCLHILWYAPVKRNERTRKPIRSKVEEEKQTEILRCAFHCARFSLLSSNCRKPTTMPPM